MTRPREAFCQAMSMRENLLNLLAKGQDNALLRFTLGQDYWRAGDTEQAVAHLREAVALDENYSAAWKLLGRALTDRGDASAAIAAYTQGISVAQRRGDKQAEKEMQVFLRRLQQSASSA